MRKPGWGKYNQDLVKRGSITFYIDEAAFNSLTVKRGKGRPRLFSHPLIQLLLILKIQFHLPYRALEGFAKSILPRFKADIVLPTYTVICRRAKELSTTLPKLSRGKTQVVLLDASGIKIFGEGEWKVRTHGKSKRRKWIKLHIAMDEKTHEILAMEITDSNVADCEIGPKLIDNCPKNVRTYKADGAYDTTRVREVIKTRGGLCLIPPRRNAKKRGDNGERDRAISEMRGLGMDRVGRSLWGKLTGYSKRALVEASFSRFKRIFGGSLFSRSMESQRVEGRIKCHMLNEMLRKTG